MVELGYTIKDAAIKVGLSYTFLWRKVAFYKISPHEFCRQTEALMEGGPVHGIPTKEEFIKVNSTENRFCLLRIT